MRDISSRPTLELYYLNPLLHLSVLPLSTLPPPPSELGHHITWNVAGLPCVLVNLVGLVYTLVVGVTPEILSACLRACDKPRHMQDALPSSARFNMLERPPPPERQPRRRHSTSHRASQQVHPG